MDYTKTDIETIKQWLKENLDKERFLHSIGTMDAAMDLALRFGLDRDKAKVAGLLHDCAKCRPQDELKKIVYANFTDYSDCELNNPKTLHAPASAYIAKTEFGVEDEEILTAMRWHTLGKVNMTPFEMIIFIADKIEKNTRPQEYIGKIEKTLNKSENLEKTILKCFKLTIKSLLKRKLPICITTINVYNHLLEKATDQA